MVARWRYAAGASRSDVDRAGVVGAATCGVVVGNSDADHVPGVMMVERAVIGRRKIWAIGRLDADIQYAVH